MSPFFRLLRTPLIMAGLLLFAMLVLYARYQEPRELVVVFLERNASDTEPGAMHKVELFEKLHRQTLVQLVKDFNRSNRKFRLRLQEPSRMPNIGEEPDVYQRRRYGDLENIPNLIAVFDNSWGTDILKMKDSLRKFKVPVFFLNADKNDTDYGPARFFMGNADNVPNEIIPVVKELFKHGQVEESNTLFLSEKGYIVEKAFLRSFKEHDFSIQPIALEERYNRNRRGLDELRTMIIQGFLKDRNWEEMQKSKKLIILNSHSSWGMTLIPWIDRVFENTTIIGYQSVIVNTPGFAFGLKNNRLIVLSVSDHSIPEELFLLRRKLRDRDPEPFQRLDSPFFVRRCVVAMDILTSTLKSQKGQNWKHLGEDTDSGHKARKRFLQALNRIKGREIEGNFGRFKILEDGSLFEQNLLVQFKRREQTPYSSQLRYEEGGQETALHAPLPKLVPNVHFRFQGIKIDDIDVAKGTFRADLDYWLRQKRGLEEKKKEGDSQVAPNTEMKSDPTVPPLVPFKAVVDSTVQQANAPTLTKEDDCFSLHRIFGTFSASLDGSMYPFDRHLLRIELQAPKRDDDMRLSREELKEDDTPEIDGWTVEDKYLTVESRDSNPVRFGEADYGGQSTQSDAVILSLKVRRTLWNAILLVILPLLLLLTASLAVLYIKFGSPSELGNTEAFEPGEEGLQGGNGLQSPSKKENEALDLESRKTQTELNLGCVTAVIAYLISYAALTPRIGTLIYSDYLMGFALLVSVLNFAFIVAVRDRVSTPFLRGWDLKRYRFCITIIVICGVSIWLGRGLYAYISSS